MGFGQFGLAEGAIAITSSLEAWDQGKKQNVFDALQTKKVLFCYKVGITFIWNRITVMFAMNTKWMLKPSEFKNLLPELETLLLSSGRPWNKYMELVEEREFSKNSYEMKQ